MSTVDILSPAGDKAGSVELPAEIFDVEKISIPLIHQVVVAQLAAARQGTHKTKTRGEVAGGGRKPYKQKGTGRARQGSIRAPQFTGGGVADGPAAPPAAASAGPAGADGGGAARLGLARPRPGGRRGSALALLRRGAVGAGAAGRH